MLVVAAKLSEAAMEFGGSRFGCRFHDMPRQGSGEEDITLAAFEYFCNYSVDSYDIDYQFFLFPGNIFSKVKQGFFYCVSQEVCDSKIDC